MHTFVKTSNALAVVIVPQLDSSIASTCYQPVGGEGHGCVAILLIVAATLLHNLKIRY